MGASKRLAEMVVQSLLWICPSQTAIMRNSTRLAMVRFGNVLGRLDRLFLSSANRLLQVVPSH